MSFTRMRYHFVTATKRREPFIDPENEELLHGYIRDAADKCDAQIIELGGTEDHVHIVAAIHPQVAPSQFMQRIKGESSRRIADEHDRWTEFEWQSGFGGFTLSPFDLEAVREYVRNQKEHHERNSLWSEFERLAEMRAA